MLLWGAIWNCEQTAAEPLHPPKLFFAFSRQIRHFSIILDKLFFSIKISLIFSLDTFFNIVVKLNRMCVLQGGRRHWAVNYISSQRFVITFSYLLTLGTCIEFWLGSYFIKFRFHTLQPLIVIYRMGNFVYHYWGYTSIYRPLPYPLLSLVDAPVSYLRVWSCCPPLIWLSLCSVSVSSWWTYHCPTIGPIQRKLKIT